jgi:trans-aconitate 2-methyltransferase
VPDQDAALRSIRRALTATGQAQVRLVPDGERASLESVVEQTRQAPRWAPAFAGFRDPYLHRTPAQYTAVAERNRLRVTALTVHDKAWDFGSRAAFHAFCSVGLVAWTQRLPEGEHAAFVDDVLDRYRTVAAAGAGEAGVFRFYQMDVTLACAPGAAP